MRKLVNLSRFVFSDKRIRTSTQTSDREEEVSYNAPGVSVNRRRTGNDAHFGTGFEFAGDGHWRVRLEWERFDAETQMDFVSASLLYTF